MTRGGKGQGRKDPGKDRGAVGSDRATAAESRGSADAAGKSRAGATSAGGASNRPVEVISDTNRANVLLNPSRLAILERLKEPTSSASLARQLDLPRQRLNYHMRALERHNLVALVEERKRGSALERLYHRTADTFAISIDAIGQMGTSPERVQDRFSSAYQIAHACRVIVDLGALRAGAEQAGKSLPTFMLEVDVRFADASARNAFTQELTDAVAALVQRYHAADAPRGRTFNYYVGAYPKRKA